MVFIEYNLREFCQNRINTFIRIKMNIIAKIPMSYLTLSKLEQILVGQMRIYFIKCFYSLIKNLFLKKRVQTLQQCSIPLCVYLAPIFLRIKGFQGIIFTNASSHTHTPLLLSCFQKRPVLPWLWPLSKYSQNCGSVI